MFRLLTVFAIALSCQGVSFAEFALYASGYSILTPGRSALFTVNTETGLATEIGLTRLGYHIGDGGLAYVPSTGTLYATGQNTFNPVGPTTSELFTVNINTGAATSVGWTGASAGLFDGGLAYDELQNVLFATGSSSVSTLFNVNRANGVATAIGATGSNSNLASGGLAIDVASGGLFATGNNAGVPNSTTLFSVNKSTGAASSVGLVGVSNLLDSGGLAVNPTTGQIFATGVRLNGFGQFESFLFDVNRSTGVASVIGPTGATLGFGGLTIVAVPEPNFSAVACLALARLAFARRKRRMSRMLPRHSLKFEGPQPKYSPGGRIISI